MSPSTRLTYLAAIILLILTSWPGPAQAADPTNFANCRLGAGGVFDNVRGYDLAQLNLGVYLDWRTSNNPYEGQAKGLAPDIQYLQIVRVHQAKPGYSWWGPPRVYEPDYSYKVQPSLAEIAAIAQAQPGAVWLIGNEQERVDWQEGGSYFGQDEILPEVYAKAFHEIRAVIKGADPTARIAIGGVIQPTPLRLEYLDKVWNSYFDLYQYPMGNDIDVWNIHGFILREIRGAWGADVPAGSNATGGLLSDPSLGFGDYIDAHYDLETYKNFMRTFRIWMAAKGERNKPLINTEYGGILEPKTAAQMSNFLTGSFDFMLTETDATIGYPADENRLVQQWVWYSLNDDFSNLPHFAGFLFNSGSKQLSPLGTTWQNYVSNPAKPLASVPQPNLLLINLSGSSQTASVSSGSTVDVLLNVTVANSGNVKSSQGSLTVNFWSGVPGQSSQLIASRTVSDLPGCGGSQTVTVTWANRSPGLYPWYAEVVAIPNETKTSDNVVTGRVQVVMTADADLGVNKTVNNATPAVNQNIEYTVTVKNNGPETAANVKVSDLLPEGLTYVGQTVSQGSYNQGNGQWSVGNLTNQASASLKITAQVKSDQAGKTMVNTASLLSSDSQDKNAANNNRSVNINVQGGSPVTADLRVEKSVDNPTPVVGSKVQYIITVANQGPNTATNIKVSDLLPEGLTYQSHTAGQGTYTAGNGQWSVGNLANQASATLKITATVSGNQPGKTMVNTASLLSSDSQDLNETNNSQSAEIVLIAGSPAQSTIYLPALFK
jgi:uncharacterized repeat protein (TIGR01451 family)